MILDLCDLTESGSVRPFVLASLCNLFYLSSFFIFFLSFPPYLPLPLPLTGNQLLFKLKHFVNSARLIQFSSANEAWRGAGSKQTAC